MKTIFFLFPMVLFVGCTPPKLMSNVNAEQDTSGSYIQSHSNALVRHFEKSDVHIFRSMYEHTFNQITVNIDRLLDYKGASLKSAESLREFSNNPYALIVNHCVQLGVVSGTKFTIKDKESFNLLLSEELDKCISERLASQVASSDLIDLRDSFAYRMYKDEPKTRQLISNIQSNKQATYADLLKLYHEFANIYVDKDQELSKDIISSL